MLSSIDYEQKGKNLIKTIPAPFRFLMKQLNSAHDTIKYFFAIYYSKMTPEVYKWMQQTGTNRFCTHILSHCMIERYVPI